MPRPSWHNAGPLPTRRLPAPARPLVRAKLRNWAALLESATFSGEPTVVQLRERAEQCATAESLDALRGQEGAARPRGTAGCRRFWARASSSATGSRPRPEIR